jgi:hypothetical protein
MRTGFAAGANPPALIPQLASFQFNCGSIEPTWNARINYVEVFPVEFETQTLANFLRLALTDSSKTSCQHPLTILARMIVRSSGRLGIPVAEVSFDVKADLAWQCLPARNLDPGKQCFDWELIGCLKLLKELN